MACRYLGTAQYESIDGDWVDFGFKETRVILHVKSEFGKHSNILSPSCFLKDNWSFTL